MKLTKLALIGAVTLSTVSVGTSAFAEEKANMKSKTDVTFIEDKSTTDPNNPENPNEKVTPENPGEHEKGTAGPLSINYVSNLHFGENVISGNDQTYFAKLDTVKKGNDKVAVPNFVSVTDKRGTNVGWKLKVKQDGQFKSGANELTNAALTLSNPVVNSVTDQTYAPKTFNKSVTLNPGGAAVEITTAEKGKGMGDWTTAFGKGSDQGKESVSLFVPGTTAKVKDAKYTATLTWTLEDTPN
ncbi:WxL domain-containing protein [Bacillus mobilis]|uniref:Cell surface protein n=2 Tax=Bacillus cereus group TaxID=86661 RepID=A0A1C4F651_BACCE|nr:MULTISPECIES: WxL domain-containing protein [Bacillus cereus group]MCC2462760.1 WxL domain-containing protein [Bacillus mobilis]MCU5432006.1 WxL domain-containing protein [Bacillus mobilis]MCU5592020.1 WxL domain-containing protein [Bacillus mobilis]MCU5735808.1 WxL domain-containing protein [Bacillus mobilis]MCU9559215.1 WxL domain-containing protein [Bacillus mobilis]